MNINKKDIDGLREANNELKEINKELKEILQRMEVVLAKDKEIREDNDEIVEWMTNNDKFKSIAIDLNTGAFRAMDLNTVMDKDKYTMIVDNKVIAEYEK